MSDHAIDADRARRLIDNLADDFGPELRRQVNQYTSLTPNTIYILAREALGRVIAQTLIQEDTADIGRKGGEVRSGPPGNYEVADLDEDKVMLIKALEMYLDVILVAYKEDDG